MSSTKLLAIGAALSLGLFACTPLTQTPLKSQTTTLQRQVIQPVVTNPRLDLEKIGLVLESQTFSELKKPLVFQSRDTAFGIKAEGCCNDTSDQRPNSPTSIYQIDFGQITNPNWGDDPTQSEGWNQWNGDYFPQGKGVVLSNPGPGQGNRNDPGEYQAQRPDLLETGLHKTLSLLDTNGKALYQPGDKIIIKMRVSPTYTHAHSDTTMYVKFDDPGQTIAVSNILRGADTTWQEMHLEVTIPECATTMTLNLLAYLGQGETSSVTFETLSVEQVPAEYYSNTALYTQGFEEGGVTTPFGPNSPDVTEEFGRDFYVVDGVTGSTHSQGGDKAVTLQNSGAAESGLVQLIELPAYGPTDKITVEMFTATTFQEGDSASLVGLEFLNAAGDTLATLNSSKVNRFNYRWLIIDRAEIPVGSTHIKVVPKVLVPNANETGSLLIDDLKVTLVQASDATPPAPQVCVVPTPTPTPMTPEEAELALGVKLFFEPRLSSNNQMSCATCHDPAKGFSNGLAVAAGVTGAQGSRNVPTIYEVVNQTLTFWDGRASSLEEQALLPIENPVEMNDTLDNVIAKLSADPEYVTAFSQAYNAAPNSGDLAKAIARFERELKVEQTPFARYEAGDTTALTDAQVRGRALFFGRAACSSCHSGPSFTDQTFKNIGIANGDQGRGAITGDFRDNFAFKVPTLINVSKTAPYMHDGSKATLLDVVNHYDNPPAFQGPPLPNITLSDQDKSDLVDFLNALSADDNLDALRGN